MTLPNDPSQKPFVAKPDFDLIAKDLPDYPERACWVGWNFQFQNAEWKKIACTRPMTLAQLLASDGNFDSVGMLIPPGEWSKTDKIVQDKIFKNHLKPFVTLSRSAADTFKPRGLLQERALKPLSIIRFEELEGAHIPDREWLVRDWIPNRVVTLLYGDGGTGKSLLAQQLQTASSLALHWAGCKVASVKSLGIYCEDDADELARRQRAINRNYGISFKELTNMRAVSRVGEDNLLMTFSSKGVGELTGFHRQVLEQAQDEKVRLVVVDTAADTFGGNENDRPQVRQFISHCLGSIALKINGAVVLCAHPSRSGLSTGEGDGASTAWNNSARSRLFLSIPRAEDGAEPDANARILERRKANYAARFETIKLRWTLGAFAVEAPALVNGRIQDCAKNVFLTLLSTTLAEGRTLSPSKNAGNYAPAIFAKRPERDGYNKRQFEFAMEQLFADGLIRVEEYGPPSKRSAKIVLAGNRETEEIESEGPGEIEAAETE